MRSTPIHLLLSSAALRLERVEIEGDAYRHLFRARRLQQGQRLRVVDGAGAARFAVVEGVGRSSAALRLLEPAPANDPLVRVELAVAAIRPERAAWLVEKATELGVAAVRFFGAERTQRQRETLDLRRLSRVAAAALEQSGGATLPALGSCASFGELVELASRRHTVLLDATAEPFALAAPPSAPPHLVVVGPEGGLTPAESSSLVDAGAARRSLGTRTLRAETAAVVGAALLLARAQPPGDAPPASR